MIPAIPIVAALLAVLDDEEPIDFEELFQRAIIFAEPEVFWAPLNMPEPRKGREVQDPRFEEQRLRSLEIERKLVPALISLYENQKYLPFNDETFNLIRIVTRNGRYAKSFFDVLAEELTPRFADARDLFDLRDRLIRAQPFFDMAVMLKTLCRRNFPDIVPHIREAIRPRPLHPDALRPFYQFDVPVFAPVAFCTETTDREIRKYNTTRTRKIIRNPGESEIVSWDENRVLTRRVDQNPIRWEIREVSLDGQGDRRARALIPHGFYFLGDVVP
jgi:hypothetical protein